MPTDSQPTACCAPTAGDATPESPEALRALVREQYAQVATRQTGCCGSPADDARVTSQGLGYTADVLASVPDAANLGVGCGNPNAISALLPGEVVIDLGAGAGLDALIAAQAVGPTGRVIGVDMTPEMLKSARANAVAMDVHGFVEFREGLIEDLPVRSASADVIISNCVINLSPDKPAAFREAFRVLKPGGRLAVSDVVLSAPLPADVAALADAYVACVAGAAVEADYLGAIEAAGFVDVTFTRTSAIGLFAGDSADPLVQQGLAAIGPERIQALEQTVWSYQISARKPANG